MATMFVRHQVADYAAFRVVYDWLAVTRNAHNVTADAVYQAADDPNDVTVTHDFVTIAAARAFAGSAELQAAMRNAGVLGAPMVWFTNRA
jgi:hypothetical protein